MPPREKPSASSYDDYVEKIVGCSYAFVGEQPVDPSAISVDVPPDFEEHGRNAGS